MGLTHAPVVIWFEPLERDLTWSRQPSAASLLATAGRGQRRSAMTSEPVRAVGARRL
jgi:hypothetical protein